MKPRNILITCIAVIASNVHAASEREYVEFHNAYECHSNISNSKSGIEIRTQGILNRSGGVAKLHCPISLSRVDSDGVISWIRVSVSAYQHNIPSFLHMKCTLELHHKRDGSVFASFSDKIFLERCTYAIGIKPRKRLPQESGRCVIGM
jgi:hypothetical protein